MITVPLDKKGHDRKGFNCGIDALNNYLRMMANQQDKKDNTRTFVLEDINKPEKIIGYYTMTSLDLSILPEQLQKKHTNSQSAGLITRLAVDQQYFKQGYGEWLLIDALKKLLLASETVAFLLVIVDAKDGAVGFYKKFEFTDFLDIPNKLYMTIANIRKSIK